MSSAMLHVTSVTAMTCECKQKAISVRLRAAAQIHGPRSQAAREHHLMVALLCALGASLKRELAALGLGEGRKRVLVQRVLRAPHNRDARKHLDAATRRA